MMDGDRPSLASIVWTHCERLTHYYAHFMHGGMATRRKKAWESSLGDLLLLGRLVHGYQLVWGIERIHRTNG